MKKIRGDKEARARGWVVRKRPRSLPAPESELWPEYCRGKNWTWAAARFYVGRCQLCAYSCGLSEGRRRLDRLAHLPTFLLCTNHPDSPGHLRDVLPTDRCRNFKAARWLRPRSGTKKKGGGPAIRTPRGKVRRIPLGGGLFATVDARDYKRLSKYKWCVLSKYGTPYAVRRTKDGRMVYMHREIMHAPKGMVVDHLDHNTLNNRRCNLHICTQAQNQANAGPRARRRGMWASSALERNGRRRSTTGASDTTLGVMTIRSMRPGPATARRTRSTARWPISISRRTSAADTDSVRLSCGRDPVLSFEGTWPPNDRFLPLSAQILHSAALRSG